MLMRRVAKPEGQFNIAIEEVERPTISDTEVLIRAERTLISRGSEIFVVLSCTPTPIFMPIRR